MITNNCYNKIRVYTINFSDEILKYDIENTVYFLEYTKKLSEVAMLSNKIAEVHIALNTDMRYIDFYKQEKA